VNKVGRVERITNQCRLVNQDLSLYMNDRNIFDILLIHCRQLQLTDEDDDSKGFSRILKLNASMWLKPPIIQTSSVS